MRILIFLLVSASLLVAVHLFLYRRWVRDIWPKDHHFRSLGLWLMVALGLSAVLARPMLYLFGGPGTRMFAVWVLTWMGFALGGMCVQALLDGVRKLVVKKPVSDSRRQFLSRALAGTSVIVSGATVGYGIQRALGPAEVSDVTVKLPRLPKELSGLTLVQISDLHVGEILQERFMVDLVQRCNALKPDAMLITGDLVDGSVPRLGRFVAPLQNLQSRYGSFFVTGNHDYYSGADEWCEALSGLGIQALRNRHVSLGDKGGGASIDLAGVDDWGSRRRGHGYDLAAALKGHDADRALVLLAHQPSNFAEAAGQGVGLQLSGHTHGGQVFPLTQLMHVLWPYSAGKYSLNDSTIYVSRGTGFVGPPMRVNSPPEIVRITLVS